MAEPTNPLFEQEKEFLERKKLEYERALRGDVEHIKDQTLNVGKLALIGAGAATGVWLLAKAFRGRKHKDESGHDEHDERSARHEYDRDGRYDQGYGMAYDEQADNPFFGYNDDDERWMKHESARFDDEADDNFDPHEAMARGVREYEQEQTRDARRNPSLSASQRGDEDDNGLSQYPDFPAHSAPRHGENDAQSSEGFYFTDDDHFGYSEPAGRSADAADRAVSINSQPAGGRPFYHAEHSHPTANRAPDDSRRLPDSDGFQNLIPAQNLAAASPQAKVEKSGTLGSMLLKFATSEAGRSLLGQAAAAGLALLGKAVKERMPEEPAETDKTSDLAA